MNKKLARFPGANYHSGILKKKFTLKILLLKKLRQQISKFCVLKKTVNLKVRPSIRIWTPPHFNFVHVYYLGLD